VNAVETGTMHKAVTAKTRAAVKRCEAFCMTVDMDDQWGKAWVGASRRSTGRKKGDASRKSGGGCGPESAQVYAMRQSHLILSTAHLPL
jgi:hypothetical protein